MKKIITGEWDGEPIWREQTAVERLDEMFGSPLKEIEDFITKINFPKNHE